MCSIAGSHLASDVWEGLEMMKHRSPDGFNVSTGDFNIGMGRLAIVDIANAEFPMTREGYTITFNGEIYNYRELYEELVSENVCFTTSTDTEVLLYAFIQWGDKCLDKLNGMFAFAIRTPEGDVFCARDLAGEKPFYYTDSPFRFASEAKCLTMPFQLSPGHCLWYRNGHVSVSRWFYPRTPHIPPYLDEASYVLEGLLNDSVRLRTRSEVPYALYLSDGVDSNLINSFHKFDHTLTYVDGDYGEDMRRCLGKIVYHLDYPVASFSAYGLFTLAERANKSGVKVVLSGEGADELFGGYVRYVGNEFNRLAAIRYPSYATMFPHRDLMKEEFYGNMQELLRMGDRMASAHGVENRCPFLDRRVVEFAWALPMEWKISGLDTKVILREILKRRNPDFHFKEKHGLYCSVNKWLGVDDKFDKATWLKAQK